MFRNYLKVAIRNTLRHKSFTAINLAGLAIGMACCMIIFLYVAGELTYDGYHADAERVFRIGEDRTVPNIDINMVTISPAVAPAIRSRFPQAEAVARIDPVPDALVCHDGDKFNEKRIYMVDQALFDIFTIPFIKGDPKSALDKPLTCVISESLASKYFGEEDAFGRSIEILDSRMVARGESKPRSQLYTIAGVVEDPPSNTHFKYGLLLSLKPLDGNPQWEHWDASDVFTYVKLRPDVTGAEFEDLIRRLAYDYNGDDLRSWGQDRNYYLQAITDIHFRSNMTGSGFMGAVGELDPPGDMLHVYVYSAVGLLVLLVGCMNFINLSNARSVHRAREVGLRKVVGAGWFQLVRQFIGESLLITVLALGLGLVLVELLLPLFNDMAGTELKTVSLFDPVVIAATVGLVLFVGVVAGGYPAFVLTSYKPALILKGSACAGTKGSSALRVLVLGQFMISIFLAIGTVTVYQQLQFMRDKSPGFELAQKVVIPLMSGPNVRQSADVLKNEFLNHHSITGATVSSSVPGRLTLSGLLREEGNERRGRNSTKYIAADYDFVDVYGLQIIAGRPLLEQFNDKKNGFLINEAALPLLDCREPSEALGKRAITALTATKKEIVGVFRNFHCEGLQKEVGPMYIEHKPIGFLKNYMTVQLAPGDIRESMAHLEDTWQTLLPDIPFQGYFLDTDFDLQYRHEEQVGKSLGMVSLMGLTIASLGLLGLASFIARQRTREIGIRKVLGASVSSIVQLLSRQFFVLVLLAGLVACPLAWKAMEHWLRNFAVRMDMNWTTFAIPVCIAFLMALATVGYQAARAARANPVESLRHE